MSLSVHGSLSNTFGNPICLRSVYYFQVFIKIVPHIFSLFYFLLHSGKDRRLWFSLFLMTSSLERAQQFVAGELPGITVHYSEPPLGGGGYTLLRRYAPARLGNCGLWRFWVLLWKVSDNNNYLLTLSNLEKWDKYNENTYNQAEAISSKRLLMSPLVTEVNSNQILDKHPKPSSLRFLLLLYSIICSSVHLIFTYLYKVHNVFLHTVKDLGVHTLCMLLVCRFYTTCANLMWDMTGGSMQWLPNLFSCRTSF